MHEDFIHAVEDALARVAVPADAEPMRRYMKSAMPFLGVKKPARAAALRPVLAAFQTSDPALASARALALFRAARHREVRYAATDYLRRHRRLLGADALDALAAMIVEGAWWDHVDEIAAHLVGGALARDPAPTAARLRAWARGDELWLRRAAILAQLRFGASTDRALLDDCIAPSIERGEFWLRKAIGWALRALSRADAAWVRAYVGAHPGLSPLSRREALRLIDVAPRASRGAYAPRHA
ncbi:MAG: DNA alkylation repair protein [Sandaracinaceae bacterium]|nr:DNA alkylation repair protein [Sandaracinaceae bacterium]